MYKLMNYTETKYDKNITECPECSICLNLYKNNDNIIITKCNHHFHYDCILEWLNNKGTCPLCRYILKKIYTQPREMISNDFWNEYSGVIITDRIMINHQPPVYINNDHNNIPYSFPSRHT